MFKIVTVSYSLKIGGASIATKNFNQLLFGNSLGFSVDSISQDNAGKFQFLKRLISYGLIKFQFDGNPIKHSLNLFSYKPVLDSFKLQSNCVHHLHWINNDTLSVLQFSQIPKGSIITMHDEWIYCGAEHTYKIHDDIDDFVTGYSVVKKGLYGLNWNYIIWKIKMNRLSKRNDLIYTVPSKWLQKRAMSSLILKNKDIRYLPNPINVETFKPQKLNEVISFRSSYLIEEIDFVICFGAIGGKKNKLKGGNILNEALLLLQSILPEEIQKRIVLLEFGGFIQQDYLYGFRRISLGKIYDFEKLALIYSSVDVTVVPSMVESFGQVAAESLACGTPVVCFETSGLIDIVTDNKSGLYCKPFESKSLAQKLFKIINFSKEYRFKMGEYGRAHIKRNFSFNVIKKQYFEILKDAFEIKNNLPAEMK